MERDDTIAQPPGHADTIAQAHTHDTRYARTIAAAPVDSNRGALATGFAERYAFAPELLGQGGMGSVYLVEDRVVGRSVAMKVALADHSARFVREARVQGQLEHPAVVPVYDLGVDPAGRTFFTMKRVVGVTLADVIAQLRRGGPEAERFSRRRLLTAFSALCLAIDFAHERGVVHRDLKPANLMIGDYGESYVLDWGIARLRFDPSTQPELGDERTDSGVIIGTIGYMPPEQLRGEQSRIGPASDVYALGVILFELLALEPLHHGRDFNQLSRSILDGADARPSLRAPERQVPPELDAICVRATRLDPAERYPSARALHDAIERFLDGERDEERRRAQAAEHAQAARALADGADGHARKEAMREVGRAIALDPSNQEALQVLVRLLAEPPRESPPEVEQALEQTQAEHRRNSALVSGVAYGSLLAYLPLLLWLGVRDWTTIGLFYAFALATSVWSIAIGKLRRSSAGMVLAVAILSDVAFAFTSHMFGPLVLTPGLVITSSLGFGISLGRRARAAVFVAGALALLVPLALELAGVIAPSYRFVDGNMVIVPHTLGLPPTATLVVLTLAAVSGIATGLLAISPLRDNLVSAERKLHLQSWQIRQLVPDEALPQSSTMAAP